MKHIKNIGIGIIAFSLLICLIYVGCELGALLIKLTNY